MRKTLQPLSELPTDGLLSVREVLPFLPIRKSTWYAGVKAGIYPQPVRSGPRKVAWRAQDIRRLIECGKADKPQQLGLGGVQKAVLSRCGLCGRWFVRNTPLLNCPDCGGKTDCSLTEERLNEVIRDAETLNQLCRKINPDWLNRADGDRWG